MESATRHFARFTLSAFFLRSFSLAFVVPAHAAGIIVNTNADSDTTSGDCTAGSGADVITFAANYTITLTSNLPDITDTDDVTITATARRIPSSRPQPVTQLPCPAVAPRPPTAS